MSLSNYTENAILDKVLRNVDFTVTTVYVSLHTADPGETGASEVSGGSYARQTGTFTAATNGTSETTANLSFTNMPAVTVTHVGLWDASVGGNFLAGGALTSSRVVSNGQTIQIDSGDLTVSIAGVSSMYLRNKLLDKILRNTNFTVSAPYVSTHTAAPGDTGANESSGGSYARQSSTFSAASGGSTSNNANLIWSNMPAGTLTHWGAWDASTGGNFLMGGALTASVALNAGDTFQFNSGNLTITAD